MARLARMKIMSWRMRKEVNDEMTDEADAVHHEAAFSRDEAWRKER